MARHFTRGSSEKVTTSLGNLGFAFGPGTMAAIIRPASGAVTYGLITVGLVAANNYQFFLDNNVRRLGWARDDAANVVDSAGGPTLTNNAWAFVAITKATGTVAPRFHVYDYVTNTWTHHDAGSTIANSGVPTTSAKLGTNSGDTAFLDGDMAVAGVWNVVLTDTQIESLAYDLPAWFAPAQPKGLWLLDQSATTINIPDISGGGANQSALVGTTIATSSVPVWNQNGWFFTEKQPAAAVGGTADMASSSAALMLLDEALVY